MKKLNHKQQKTLRRTYAAAVTIVLANLAIAASLYAQTVNYTGFLQFSTGKYIFAQRTNSLYFYNGLIINAGQFSVSASIPLIVQNSPWISTSGAGMIPSGGTQHSQVGKATRRNKITLVDSTNYEKIGLGDPLISGTFNLLRESGVIPGLDFTLGIKVPMASANQGFGTGEWDYGFGGSLSKSLGGTFIFVDVSYWILGDLPDLDFEDPVLYSLAIGRTLAGGEWGVLASISGNSRTMERVDPPMQVTLAGNYQVSADIHLMGSVAVGLTETSPDFVVSLGWRTGI